MRHTDGEKHWLLLQARSYRMISGTISCAILDEIESVIQSVWSRMSWPRTGAEANESRKVKHQG
jgi:hypothetical protein